ncbi:MAG: DNA repair exonuclease [bacterium]
MPARREMELFFCADTHLGFDQPVRPRILRRRRGPDFFANFRRFLADAVAAQADLVVHGGDFFFRSRVPKAIVDTAYEILLEFAGHGIPIYIVPGNHECSVLPTSLFVSHPNIRIFAEPTTFVQQVDGATVLLAGFPFHRRTIRCDFTRVLARTGWQAHDADVRLLCCHQTVAGATVGPSDYTFRRGDDVVRIEELPADFDAILAGHIHRRQILRRSSMKTPGATPATTGPPVLYPGSIERTSFAEKDEDKGYFRLRWRRTAAGRWQMQAPRFVSLPARPMVDLVLEARLTTANLARYIRSRIDQIDQGAIVRFRCADGLPPPVRGRLTGEFLRELLPDTMNYQFDSRFFRDRKGDS